MTSGADGSPVVLALDTATEATAVAAVRGGEVLAQVHEEPAPGERPRHAEELLVAVEEVVRRSGGWSAVGRVAVGTGPGTFTGLRIGLATARALARSAGAEIVGVSTLEPLALGAPAGQSPVLAVIDARRDEAFAALYRRDGDGGLELLSGPIVAPPEELEDRLGAGREARVAVGNGAVRYRDRLSRPGLTIPPGTDAAHRVSAEHLAALGDRIGDAGAHPPEPSYMRTPDAQRWRERDGRSTGS